MPSDSARAARPARSGRPARLVRLADDRGVLLGSVSLVAAGAASSVVLSGLRFGERLLPEAVAFGRDLGVSVTLERRVDHPAIVVRPLAHRIVRVLLPA